MIYSITFLISQFLYVKFVNKRCNQFNLKFNLICYYSCLPPVPVRVNKAVKHHVCYVEHSQPTNVGTPTKDQNRSKETPNNIGKIDFN